MSIKSFLLRLQKSTDFWFLLGTSLVFFLLRFPSFFEPYWYGDEGIYEVIGFALRHGRLLYQGIWDNKPPLLYLIYGVGSGDQTTARVLSFLVGLSAIGIFFFLSKKLFEKRSSSYVATGLLVILFGLPLLEGNIANAENFMILPSVGAAFLVVSLVWKKQKTLLSKKSLLTFLGAGILLGLSFLIKVVAVFDVAALILFFFFLTFEDLQKSSKQIVAHIGIFFVGFCLPILLTALFFLFHGAFKIFLQSTLFSNIGYVNYGNQFIIPQGLLIFKLLILSAISITLFIKRKQVSPSFIFITLWLSFSVFSALFSQRPYTHYILVLIPSLCLFAAYLLEKQTNVSRNIQAIVFIGLIIFLVQTFWIYSKTTAYYQNFIQYVLGQKDTTAYQSFFDKSVPEDYALAQFLQTHMKPSDGVFIWGNSGQIYKMANTLPPGRYIVAYHIDASSGTRMETFQALEKQNPKYVIIQANAPAFPYPLHGYQELYNIDSALIYERVF